MSVVIVVHRNADLLQVVATLGPASSLTSLLHSWEQQCDQNGNNRNYNQKLNQRKALPAKRNFLHKDTFIKTDRKEINTNNTL